MGTYDDPNSHYSWNMCVYRERDRTHLNANCQHIYIKMFLPPWVLLYRSQSYASYAIPVLGTLPFAAPLAHLEPDGIDIIDPCRFITTGCIWIYNKPNGGNTSWSLETLWGYGPHQIMIDPILEIPNKMHVVLRAAGSIYESTTQDCYPPISTMKIAGLFSSEFISQSCGSYISTTSGAYEIWPMESRTQSDPNHPKSTFLSLQA